MAIQQTPPPGWPHTEAEKYRTHIYPEALPQELSRPGENMPAGSVEPPVKKKRSGCGCFITLLTLLAIFGAVTAILVPIIEDQDTSVADFIGSSEESDARSSFLGTYPSWQVEVVDRPASDPLAVRIVAWNYDLSIGRIVFMDPRPDSAFGYEVRPLTRDYDTATESALLEAFAQSWYETEFTYIRFAEPVDQSVADETWRISYRTWDESADDWSEVRETLAIRWSSGEWLVAGPDGILPQVTPGTETTETQ